MPVATTTERVAEARAAEITRRRQEGGRLRPLAFGVLAIVVAAAATTDPRPALDGRGLGVSIALIAYAAGVLAVLGLRQVRRDLLAVVVLGAAAVALGALQPAGPAAIAASLAVFVAFSWLASSPARVVATAVAVGVAIAALAGGGAGVGDAAGDVLLLALMAVVATLIRRSYAERERTEVLYAELQEARDAQATAAAAAERGRIAGELHDVLAHSLSGAAIQLQGARRLLARDAASPAATAAVDRAAELVREGLVDARRAVGALRGDALPTVTELPALVARLGEDLRIEATFAAGNGARAGDGPPDDAVAPEAGLALYRGVQEALTNAARHAPGASVVVALHRGADALTLTVTNPPPAGGPVEAPRSADGGGHGLEAMRERAARAGGTCTAGASPDGGWVVRIAVPR